MKHHVAYGLSLGLVAAAGVLFSTAAGAQTAPAAAVPPAAVATNVPDYSQGFRTFIRMGLPDTSKAKYVKLDYYSRVMHDVGMMSYEIQLAGNAWLVSENKEARSVLISAVGRTLELLDEKTYRKSQTNRAANVSAETGNWAPADLSRDLAKATAFVDKKIKAKAAGNREARYDSFLRSDGPYGTLFLLAAFAWQNGRIQEANALAGALFTLVGDHRKVIVGALNILADDQLDATADSFRKTRDWSAYHAKVVGLLQKYPAGWRQAGAAKMLADRLQTRAAMKEPPAIQGEGLGEEDQKLAKSLAMEASQTGMYGWSSELWILSWSKKMRVNKDDSVISRIKARGVSAIPLLIAMVPDETLCPLRRSEMMGQSMYTSYSSDDARKSEAERAQRLFNRMDRPLTRGEIARALLAPLCRREANERHDEAEIDPEEAIQAAKQAYAVLKTLAPTALATHFLKNGDPNQQMVAVQYMLQNDLETHAPAIEAYLLAPPSEESNDMRMGGHGNGLAQQYVQQRGEQAAEFVEKYVARLKKIELPTGMADDAEYKKMMEKQTEREIKTLRAMVKKQDLAEAIAEWTKSGKEQESSVVYAALERHPAAKSLPLLLAAAIQTTNVAARVRILEMMPMLRYAGMRNEQLEEDEEDTETAMIKSSEKSKLSLGTNAPAWRILLADTRAMPSGSIHGRGAEEWTVADMAASGIESLYGASSRGQYGNWGGAENLRPDVVLKIKRARAAARLEGKPEDQLPKMPSADDVSAERRQAIEADVLKATPAALPALLEKLTDAERLYLIEAADDNEAIMKALDPLSRRIASVKTVPALQAADAARLQKLVGTMVATNAIAAMREICTRHLTNGVALAITLSPGGLGQGLSIHVAPVGDMQRVYGSGYMSMLGGIRRGLVMGTVMGPGPHGRNSSHSMWLVDLPALAAPTGKVVVALADIDDNAEERLAGLEREFENQQEEFETAVEAFCKPDEALGQYASVSFTGMIPSSKKEKKGAEDEDGDEDEDEEDIGMMDPF